MGVVVSWFEPAPGDGRDVWWFLLIGCPSPAPRSDVNVLLVIADDVGVDKVGAYHAHPDPPLTPTIDALAADGVLFRSAYANPKCSPTRGGLLTGRYGFRYDIGDHLVRRDHWALPHAETTLPEVLDTIEGVTWSHAALGKWHLGGRERSGPWGPVHPNVAGFDHYAGPLANLNPRVLSDGEVQSYDHFEKVTDGTKHIVSEYATTDTTDDAVAWIADATPPWFLVVAYNDAHSPYEVPPDRLNPIGTTEADTMSARYDAKVTALDLELGRLLDSMDAQTRDHTLVVFLGDNGTPELVKTGPEQGRPGKQTLYEGGVHVPLVMAGALVDGRGEVDALVGHTDLFALVADVAGAREHIPGDSVSPLPYLSDPDHPPQREVVFAERFVPNGPGPRVLHNRMVRDDRHKLITRLDGSEELYDLQADPFEQDDLLDAALDPAAEDAYLRLHAWLGWITY